MTFIPIPLPQTDSQEIPVNIRHIDHIIQGTSLIAEIRISADVFNDNPSVLKNELVNRLATAILEQKLVEFTKMESFASFEVICRARVFLAPDSQVRLLREHKIIK